MTQPAQRWPQQNGQPAPAHQGYRQQPSPQGYAPPARQQQDAWPGQQQDYHAPQGSAHTSQQYAPQQYDRYAAHQQPGYPAEHGHGHGRAAAADQGHAQTHAHDHGYTPTLDPYPPQSGYGQSPAAPSSDYTGYVQPQDGHHGYDHWQGQQHATPDPRGYDLGSYMPNTLNQADPAAAMADEWALQQGYPAQNGHYPEDEFFETDGYARPPAGTLAQSYMEDEFQDEEYEDEPPRRRGRRAALVLTALVGAVGVGGALAYGYNSLLGPNPSGTPPIIKSDAGPVKSKPADPGGKHFAYTDSKVMGRLGDNGSATTTGSVSDSDGTRRVQTVVVGRDGSITPSAPPAAPSESSSVSVPGLTLVDGFGRPLNKPGADAGPPTESRRAQGAPPARQEALTPPATPQKPVMIAKAEPSSRARSDADDDFGTRAAPPPAKPKKPVSTAALTPAPPARSASSGTSGYVAVLASVPASSSSRLDALKRFADLQQQYGNALENKTPDVQEANLGDRGTYHRLVAGPPGSREQANTVCAELKSAGYTDCWVLAY